MLLLNYVNVTFQSSTIRISSTFTILDWQLSLSKVWHVKKQKHLCLTGENFEKQCCDYVWLLLQLWKWTTAPPTFLPFLFRKVRGGKELHATLWFEPQACMKSDLVCARWNNSYGMIPNSRNTTCWSLPEIGRVSHCASVDRGGLKRAALVITTPQGSLSDHSSSLHALFTYWSATPSPIIPRTDGCLFRQWTWTGFHCNLCRRWQWKHHSRVSSSGETAVQQCK